MTNEVDRPPLPIIERPSPGIFWMTTWTGRIILLNTLVFLITCVMSKSVLMPDMRTLVVLGAKDPVGLARGEWWRFFTPIFLHIGIVHFAVNSYMLYQIGYQIESVLGQVWFLFIYIISGVFGNIASALATANLSAGASGALFGLLGAGFYLERSIGRRIAEITGKRPRRRVYAMTVVLNLAIGLVVPFIDNAAHLGGLMCGTTLTMAMMFIRPNRLQLTRKSLGIVILSIAIVVMFLCGWIASTKTYTMSLLLDAAESAEEIDQKFRYLKQAFQINPGDGRVIEQINQLVDELNQSGYQQESIDLRRFLEQRTNSN